MDRETHDILLLPCSATTTATTRPATATSETIAPTYRRRPSGQRMLRLLRVLLVKNSNLERSCRRQPVGIRGRKRIRERGERRLERREARRGLCLGGRGGGGGDGDRHSRNGGCDGNDGRWGHRRGRTR